MTVLLYIKLSLKKSGVGRINEALQKHVEEAHDASTINASCVTGSSILHRLTHKVKLILRVNSESRSKRDVAMANVHLRGLSLYYDILVVHILSKHAKRLILYIHINPASRLIDSFGHYLFKRVFRGSEIIAVSEDHRRVLYDFYGNGFQYEVIDNFIPNTNRASKMMHPKNCVPCYLYYSPLVPSKGSHILRDIMNTIDHTCSFKIIGYGAVAFKQQCIISNHFVEKIEAIDEVAYSLTDGVFNGVDMLLYLSLNETYAMSMAEAIAFGIPVVCSSSLSGLQYLQQGVNCVFFNLDKNGHHDILVKIKEAHKMELGMIKLKNPEKYYINTYYSNIERFLNKRKSI